MRLPAVWEEFLHPYFNLIDFYRKLDAHVAAHAPVIPRPELIFNVFTYMTPAQVTCVLYGEDPYPRTSSANGVAFWDAEITNWQDKTNGNGLKNILKALLVARGLADYSTPVAECRQIAATHRFPQPAQLFKRWLGQGILLINTAMTYSSPADKKKHFTFWQPFHRTLIAALNQRGESPFYILWGRKAWRWETEIIQTIDDTSKIIQQGHPTFIHQFLKPPQPQWSPFLDIEERTGLNWLP